MQDVYINYLGAYLPNNAINNDDIEDVLGQIGEKASRAKKIVLKNNGIKSRYYVIDKNTKEPLFTNSKLTSLAIRELEKKGAPLNELELLACGTSLPDQIMPNHALMVHGDLGIHPIEVVSTSGICLSGIMALKYAYMSIASKQSKNAIATGSEIASMLLRSANFQKESEILLEKLNKHPEVAFDKDFLRWMLSDGAGALWLSSTPNKSGLSFKVKWIEQISYAGEMQTCMYAGATKDKNGNLKGWLEYPQEEWLKQSIFSVKQDVKLLNENITKYSVTKPLIQIAKKRDLNSEEIDYFLPHYSSHYFREKAYIGLENAGIKIDYSKWFTNLYEKGNTGSASIYIMLEEFARVKNFKGGENILCFVPESGRFSTAFIMLETVVK